MLGGKKKEEKVVDNKATKQMKQKSVQKNKADKKTAKDINPKAKKKTVDATNVKAKKKGVNTKDVKAKKDKKIQDIHKMTIVKGIHDDMIASSIYALFSAINKRA